MSVYQKYYQENADKRMEQYAYTPPPALRFEIDGILTPVIEDFRTVERYKEYKECGFDILLAQTSGVYNGEEWESSQAKMVLDRAYEAGLKKVILTDERLRLLSMTNGGLIGEGKQFASEEELDKHIATLLAPYKDHPAFHGVLLRDEPRWTMFKAIGEIWKSVKRVCPKAFVQCNLLPIVILSGTNTIYPEGGDLYDRFKRYFEMFLDETGSDYVMYDSYPIYHSPDEFGRCFYRFWFKSLQIAGEICKRRGVKLYFVIQSFAMLQGGKLTAKTPNEHQMFYQANAVLGFGAKQIDYYTYWSGPHINVGGGNGEIRPDKSAIMSRMGEKMPLYYSVQKVNKMIQKIFPVISNFDYESDRYIIKTPFRSGPWHLEYTGRGELKYVEAVTDQEVAMVFELKDKKNGQYMYVVENITYNDAEEALGLPKQNTTLKFAPQFTKIDIFDGNEWRTEELKNGEYTATLAAGYAEYILPY